MPVPRSLAAAVQLDRRLAVLLLASCHRRHTALSSGLSNPLCHESMTAWGLQIKTTQRFVIAGKKTHNALTIDLTKVTALGHSQMELSFPFHLPPPKKQIETPPKKRDSPNTDGSSKFAEFHSGCLILLPLFQQWHSSNSDTVKQGRYRQPSAYV